jgi:tight adherence protein B
MSTATLAGLGLAGLILVGGGSSRPRLRAMATSGPTTWPAGSRGPTAARRREALAAAALNVPLGLALELRSGRDLPSALAAVARELDSFDELAARLREAGAVASAGGDIGKALRPDRPAGPDPVGAALQVTGACCDCAVTSGLPLADLLDAAASVARSRVALAGMARAELAGARSTLLVLAGLPLAGLAMGQLLGAHPVGVLLGTSWGAGCLALAVGLSAIGLLWSRAITAGVRRAMP